MPSRLLVAILLIFFGFSAEASANVPEPGEGFQVAQMGLNPKGGVSASAEDAKKTKYLLSKAKTRLGAADPIGSGF